MSTKNTAAKEVFAAQRHTLKLAGRDVSVKLGTSFNFEEVAEMGSVQADMDELLEQAREEGAVDENGDVDMSNVKYSIKFLEGQLKILHMHVRDEDGFTWDEMKKIPADELNKLRYFLDVTEEDKADEMEAERDKRAQERDKKQQQRLIKQKKSTGKT